MKFDLCITTDQHEPAQAVTLTDVALMVVHRQSGERGGDKENAGT